MMAEGSTTEQPRRHPNRCGKETLALLANQLNRIPHHVSMVIVLIIIFIMLDIA